MEWYIVGGERYMRVNHTDGTCDLVPYAEPKPRGPRYEDDTDDLPPAVLWGLATIAITAIPFCLGYVLG